SQSTSTRWSLRSTASALATDPPIDARLPRHLPDCLRARVRAAFRAAAERSLGPLVRAAFCAAEERSPAVRRRAAACACFASADFEAAIWPSRLRAVLIARDRRRETLFVPRLPASTARSAPRRVLSDTVPVSGGGSFTPARRAFDSPMAI